MIDRHPGSGVCSLTDTPATTVGPPITVRPIAVGLFTVSPITVRPSALGPMTVGFGGTGPDRTGLSGVVG